MLSFTEQLGLYTTSEAYTVAIICLHVVTAENVEVLFLAKMTDCYAQVKFALEKLF